MEGLAYENKGKKEHTYLLLEVPKDVRRLYEEGLIQNIDYVIVTHAHHDHYGDLEGLLLQKEKRGEEIIAIIPSKVNITLNIPEENWKKVKIIHTNNYKDKKINVEFFPVHHFGVPTYGVKIKFKNTDKCVGYSADTEDVVVDKLKDCDIIFHDCAGGEYHTPEDEVYKETEKLGIFQKTFCIHVNDDFKPKKMKLAEGNIMF